MQSDPIEELFGLMDDEKYDDVLDKVLRRSRNMKIAGFRKDS